jgi:hypothetical protein
MRRPRRGLPALLAALVVVGCTAGKSDTDLDQAIPPLRSQGRALQVVLHEIVESAPRGGAVRLCRALADTPVQLETAKPLPLRDVLASLAEEVGSDLAPAARGVSGEALPTLRCPKGVGDHLVIGRPPG